MPSPQYGWPRPPQPALDLAPPPTTLIKHGWFKTTHKLLCGSCRSELPKEPGFCTGCGRRQLKIYWSEMPKPVDRRPGWMVPCPAPPAKYKGCHRCNDYIPSRANYCRRCGTDVRE